MRTLFLTETKNFDVITGNGKGGKACKKSQLKGEKKGTVRVRERRENLLEARIPELKRVAKKNGDGAGDPRTTFSVSRDRASGGGANKGLDRSKLFSL